MITVTVKMVDEAVDIDVYKVKEQHDVDDCERPSRKCCGVSPRRNMTKLGLGHWAIPFSTIPSFQPAISQTDVKCMFGRVNSAARGTDGSRSDLRVRVTRLRLAALPRLGCSQIYFEPWVCEDRGSKPPVSVFKFHQTNED